MHVVVGSWEVSRARLAAPFFLPLGSSALERTDTGASVSEDVEDVVVHQFIFHLGTRRGGTMGQMAFGSGENYSINAVKS